eukprot:m.104841 g.104841  ORF g.104841 m.104841 type:complete len:632 (-) comp8902_c0_seq2:215-2110(-)
MQRRTAPGSHGGGALDIAEVLRNADRHLADSDSTLAEERGDPLASSSSSEASQRRFRPQRVPAKPATTAARAEDLGRIASLEERLRSSQHQRQMMEMKMEALSNSHREEIRALMERTQRELAETRQRQEKIQRASLTYTDVLRQIQDGFAEVVNVSEYERLREAPAPNRTLSDWVRVLLYEEVQRAVADKDAMVAALRRDREALQQAQPRAESHEGIQAASRAEHTASSMAQQCELLRADGEYLRRELARATERSTAFEQRCNDLQDRLVEAHKQRDQLYEKALAGRQADRSDYDERLQARVEEIRAKAMGDVDHARRSLLDVHARELDAVRAERDAAAEERNRLESRIKEIDAKLQAVSAELYAARMERDGRVADLSAEVKIKAFESERTQAMLEEARLAARDALRECEKQTRKVEVVTKELFDVKHTLEQRVAILDLKNTELSEKLKFYQDVDRIAGDASAVPPSARAAQLQGIALARQVAQTEAEKARLEKRIEEQRKAIGALQDELASAASSAAGAAQPQQYFAQTIKSRDETIRSLKAELDEAHARLAQVQAERDELTRTKTALFADLERLSGQRHEIEQIRRLLHATAPVRPAVPGFGPESAAASLQPAPVTIVRGSRLVASART